ncbi:MAG: hypothetical protein OXG15_08975 [Gammaproteobacteria bacterium]|nr:hypothetical protein [Gammaproteobacteria bacterium]
MLTRIIVGLAALAAIVEGVAPGVVPENILPLALVVLGLIYGAMCVDAEDATNFLVVTLAVGGAAAANALDSIHVVGSYLDGILDAQALALWGAVASILVIRIWNRLAGDDSSGGGDAE